MKTERTNRSGKNWQEWMRGKFLRRNSGSKRSPQPAQDLLPDRVSVLTDEADTQAAVERLLRVGLQEAGAEAAQLWLCNEASQALELHWEMNAAPASETEADGDRVIAAHVLAANAPLHLAPGEAQALSGMSETPAGEFAYWMPLWETGSDKQVRTAFGLLAFKSRKAGSRFTEERQQAALACAETIGLMLVNFRRHEGLRATFLQGLVQIVDTLERRHPSSQGHSQRVAALCVSMARRLNAAPEVIETLRVGALLHDLAKLLLPEALLFKPEQLTAEEFAAIRQYPELGYALGKSIDLSDDVLMLLRNHHERLDGAGYPDNLKQGELPLPLRILCVADAFDAMSSSRSHRGQITGQMRREQLNRFAGTQFDPVVVETLKNLLDSGELNAIYRDVWEPALEIVSLPSDARQAA